MVLFCNSWRRQSICLAIFGSCSFEILCSSIVRPSLTGMEIHCVSIFHLLQRLLFQFPRYGSSSLSVEMPPEKLPRYGSSSPKASRCLPKFELMIDWDGRDPWRHIYIVVLYIHDVIPKIEEFAKIRSCPSALIKFEKLIDNARIRTLDLEISRLLWY